MMSKQAIEEKRSSRRASCQAYSQFKNLDSKIPSAYNETFISDISEGGLRFRSPQFIPVHHRLSLKIDIPKAPSIEVIAKPAWIKELPNLEQYDVGVQFLTLSDTDKFLLKKFFGVSAI